jgi:hypothetical protein
MAPTQRRRPAPKEEPVEEEPVQQTGSIRTARAAVRAALAEVLELTSKQPENIVGVQRTSEGWTIDFEVIEDRRIPSSADILATYQAAIDVEGELMTFRRLRRYSRGRGDSNGGPTK